jgi:hypothetical protein
MRSTGERSAARWRPPCEVDRLQRPGVDVTIHDARDPKVVRSTNRCAVVGCSGGGHLVILRSVSIASSIPLRPVRPSMDGTVPVCAAHRSECTDAR